MKLSDRQKIFCNEYLVDLNATQAAIRAGYSKKTATSTGSKLLMRTNIQLEIKRLMDERNERTGITADRVIRQLVSIAFMDIKDFVEWGTEKRPETVGHDENGRAIVEMIPHDFVRIKDWAAMDGTLIQSVKMGKHGMIVEFPDRMRALEVLAKHTGVYDDRPNINVDVSNFVDALKQTAQQMDGRLWDNDPEMTS